MTTTLHWDIKEIKTDIKKMFYELEKIKEGMRKLDEDICKLRRRSSTSFHTEKHVNKNVRSSKTTFTATPESTCNSPDLLSYSFCHYSTELNLNKKSPRGINTAVVLSPLGVQNDIILRPHKTQAHVVSLFEAGDLS